MSAETSLTQRRLQFGSRGSIAVPVAESAAGQRSGVRDALASKRTKVLSLVAIGAGALTIYGACAGVGGGAKPAARAGSPEGQVFATAADCAASGLVEAVECELLAEQARQEHENVAVGHDTLEECEREYGVARCRSQPDTGEPGRRRSYIPVMSAFALGRSAEGKLAGAPLYSHPADGPGRFRQSAAMSTYELTARLARQARLAETARLAAGMAARASMAGFAPAASTAAARGGFGASAAAMHSSAS